MAGFLLLPLKQRILEGRLPQMDDHALATLVVLIAHEAAKTRIACPSQDRMAILAGISKQAVALAVDELAAAGWLQKSRLPASGGRTRFQYHMTYARYTRGDTSGRWLRLERHIVLNGVWAVMPPSVRRLYLCLLAMSWSGNSAFITEDNERDWLLEPRSSGAGRFVDVRYLEPSELRRLVRIEPRTFTRAWAWLTAEKLLEPVSDDSYEGEISECREGVFLANLPDLYAPAVQERMRKLKAAASFVPPGAKRLLLHTLRTSGGKETRKITCLDLPQTRLPPARDTTEPQQVFEPDFNESSTSPPIARARSLCLVPKLNLEDTPPEVTVSYRSERRAR